MKPELELYLLVTRLLSTMDEVGLPDNGFKKAVRSIESFANQCNDVMELQLSDVHGLAVHNYNVIQNNITSEELEKQTL